MLKPSRKLITLKNLVSNDYLRRGYIHVINRLINLILDHNDHVDEYKKAKWLVWNYSDEVFTLIQEDLYIQYRGE